MSQYVRVVGWRSIFAGFKLDVVECFADLFLILFFIFSLVVGLAFCFFFWMRKGVGGR